VFRQASDVRGTAPRLGWQPLAAEGAWASRTGPQVTPAIPSQHASTCSYAQGAQGRATCRVRAADARWIASWRRGNRCLFSDQSVDAPDGIRVSLLVVRDDCHWACSRTHEEYPVLVRRPRPRNSKSRRTTKSHGAWHLSVLRIRPSLAKLLLRVVIFTWHPIHLHPRLAVTTGFFEWNEQRHQQGAGNVLWANQALEWDPQSPTNPAEWLSADLALAPPPLRYLVRAPLPQRYNFGAADQGRFSRGPPDPSSKPGQSCHRIIFSIFVNTTVGQTRLLFFF
jgi:hypothetical protein